MLKQNRNYFFTRISFTLKDLKQAQLFKIKFDLLVAN